MLSFDVYNFSQNSHVNVFVAHRVARFILVAVLDIYGKMLENSGLNFRPSKSFIWVV